MARRPLTAIRLRSRCSPMTKGAIVDPPCKEAGQLGGRLLVVADDVARVDAASLEGVPHLLRSVQIGEAVPFAGPDAIEAHGQRRKQPDEGEVAETNGWKKESRNQGPTTPSYTASKR